MRLLPRDERFFDMFIAVSERTLEAAVQLEKILVAEPDQRTFLVESVKRLEHECDQITHEVITRLDRSFITPLDREDIHALASGLDDVIDLIDGLARRTRIFHVGEAPRGAILLTHVGPRATFANSRYTNAYFGINQAQSTRTGLARYTANGGVVEYGISGFAMMPIGGSLSLGLFGGYDRLGSSAADSPLIRERGSGNQFMGGLGITYEFGL